jgi:hypothetical protein
MSWSLHFVTFAARLHLSSRAWLNEVITCKHLLHDATELIMTFVNEGKWDRAARVLIGMLLLIAGWGVAFGALGSVLVAAGFIAIATGISGWCPAYTVFGLSTGKITAAHCPNCDSERRP